MQTALLVVDVQNIMFSVENFPLFNGDQVIDNITKIINQARSVSIPVIYIQHTLQSGIFAEGSDSWQIHSKITPSSSDAVIKKSKCDSFYNTTLQEELNNRNIKNLIIVGMQSEFCIDTICRRAFSFGYNTILVKDGHSTIDNDVLKASQIVAHHNAVLGESFVQLKTADETIQHLQQI